MILNILRKFLIIFLYFILCVYSSEFLSYFFLKKDKDFAEKVMELTNGKGVDKVFCISVNDPYVMDAWAKISKVENEIIMLADPFGDFANKLGVLVNKDAKGLGMRSSRYTMIIENKVIKYVAVEKETGICELSAADNVLSKL